MYGEHPRIKSDPFSEPTAGQKKREDDRANPVSRDNLPVLLQSASDNSLATFCNKFSRVSGLGVFPITRHHPKHEPLKIKEFAQIIHQII